MVITVFLASALGLAVAVVGFGLFQRARRYTRHQAMLSAAFERAQEGRIQSPPGLYGERAWCTPTIVRSRDSQITMLNIR